MAEAEKLTPEEEREVAELEQWLREMGERKARYTKWMGLGLLLALILIIAADIWLTALGKPFPTGVLWTATTGVVGYGILSLLHFATILRRPIRVKAKASKDGGEIDVQT